MRQTTSAVRPIQLLSPDVVGKIAAGEVVERPASAVKEMLENSIDAGARSITVEAVEGGRDLLRIVDDGIGISADQLPLAVQSHATSKLTSADDLFQVRTLGFRGEALASIAGVSDFVLISRPEGQPAGARIEVRHGVVGPVEECGCPFGTQIEVKNLFHSVPVRRKFLKSKQTELGHITESMLRLALAHPGLALRLIHNGRVVQERGADLDLRGTIEKYFGSDVSGALLPIHAEVDGLRLTGFVADPRIDRPNSTTQYLFVNGRFIRDRSLSHAFSEGFRGLLMTGRYPVVFLSLTVPAESVDVNVHPTKIEVRFQDPHQIYSLILSAIRTKFLSSDLTARLTAPPPKPASAPVPAISSLATPIAHHREDVNRQFALNGTPPSAAQAKLWTESREVGPLEAIGPASTPVARNPAASTSFRSEPTHVAAPPTVRGAAMTAPPPFARPTAGTGAATPARPDKSEVPTARPASSTRRALQIHNSYLVVETDEGMLLVDQHALHERILVEELRGRISKEAVEVQELLVPEPVPLSPTEVGALLDQQEVLGRIGLRVEEFGQQCILLRGYPAMLRKLRPESLLRDIAHHLLETGRAPTRDQLLEDLLNLVACKAAVKAGDPLTGEEIDQLLERRHLVEDSHHCPHGRPTLLRFTLADLERQFKRI